MLRSNFWKCLAERHSDLPRGDLERVADAIIEEIGAALERGDRVELRGFGTFGVKTRRARAGRNPRTGVTVAVKEKTVPFFRASAATLARLNRQI